MEDLDLMSGINDRMSELEQRLSMIEKRNAKVEANKEWETSLTRFFCVAILTYLMMNLILWSIGGPFPPVHALVPTCGFMLSTLSLPWVKRWWIKSRARQS